MPLSVVFVTLTIAGLIMPLIKQRPAMMLNLTMAMHFLLGLLLILIGSGWIGTWRPPWYENTASLGSGVSISLMLGTTEFWAILAVISMIILFILSAYRHLRSVSHISLLMLHFNLVGILGIILTRDIFNLYIFIEIFTLTLIGMIKAEDSHRSTVQTLIFLFVNGLASAIFLLGTVLIYRNFGVLNFDVILSDPSILNHRDTAYASVLILSAVLVKMMQFPLNFWAKPILKTGSYPARTYIGVIVPLVFTYELIKLSALIHGTVMVFILITALINIIYSALRMIRCQDGRQAFIWLCFCLASLYVMGALILTRHQVFGWIGIFVLLTSLVQFILLRKTSLPDGPDPPVSDDATALPGADLNTAIMLMIAYVTLFLAAVAIAR